MISSIIAYLVVGIIAGWIASEIMENRGLGIAGDLAVGIIGALIGGNIFEVLGMPVVGFWSGVLAATVGAVVLLLLISLVPKSTAMRHQ